MREQFFATNENRDRRFAGRGNGPAGHDRVEHGRGGRDNGGLERGTRGRGPGSGHGQDSGRGERGQHGSGGGRGQLRSGGFERGFGQGRGRLFDAGDVKLVILKLLSEQPSYGYQLIKTMEERLAGGYTPSAGVIYPTLTMLEEEGLAAASSDEKKKIYSVTSEGTEFLETNKRQIKELFERIEETGRGFKRGRSPEIMKAVMNLRSAIAARVSRESVKPELIKQIAETINAAAKAIDGL